MHEQLLIRKDRYRLLCKETKSIPLFFQPFWLDAVCGEDNWDVILHIDQNDRILAVWPYYLTKLKGFRSNVMPVLTPHLGVKFLEESNSDKLSTQYQYHKEIVTHMLVQMPETWYTNIALLPEIKEGLPFIWNGYDTSERYTYLIENITNRDQVFENFESSIRNKIRKAEKALVISQIEDVDLFYDINSKSFERQNMAIPYSRELIQRIDQALQLQMSRKILVAKDDDGTVHAGLYMVWDDMRAYNLMIGAHEAHRSSGAVPLLMWKAINLASKHVDAFDFEGGMMPNIEQFFRAFGGKQESYLQIRKTKNRLFKAGLTLIGKY